MAGRKKNANGELFIIPRRPDQRVRLFDLLESLQKTLAEKVKADPNANKLRQISKELFAKAIVEHRRKYTESYLNVTRYFWKKEKIELKWAIDDISTDEVRHTPPRAVVWLSFTTNLFHYDAKYQELFWKALGRSLELDERVRYVFSGILIPVIVEGDNCPVEVVHLHTRGYRGQNGNGPRTFIPFRDYKKALSPYFHGGDGGSSKG